MFVIRNAQIEAMLAANEEPLVSSVIEYLERERPLLIGGIEETWLRQAVRSGLARARGHQLSKPWHLVAFVALMFDVAPNFDEQPDIAQRLDQPERSADARLKAIFDPALTDAWEEAEGNYDADAWFAQTAATIANEEEISS